MKLFGAPAKETDDSATKAGASTMLDALTGPVQEIVEAADRAAAIMREQASAARSEGSAEDRASPQADLTEALLARTQDLRAEADSLAGILGRAAQQLAAAELRAAEAARPAAPPEPPPTAPAHVAGEPVSMTDRGPAPVAPAPVAPPGLSAAGRFVPRDSADQTRPGSQISSSSSQGIRLLATQMAVAGSSRDEVERRLQAEFGIADANDILDDVMGAA